MLHKKRGRIQKKPSNFLFSQFESVQKRELFFFYKLSGILLVVGQHYPGELNGDRIQFGFFEFSLIRLVRTGNFGFYMSACGFCLWGHMDGGSMLHCSCTTLLQQQANSSNMRMEEEREKTNSTLLTLIIHRQCGDAVEKRIIVLIWKCYVGQFGYSFSTFKNKGLVRVLSHPSKQLSENETGVFF